MGFDVVYLKGFEIFEQMFEGCVVCQEVLFEVVDVFEVFLYLVDVDVDVGGVFQLLVYMGVIGQMVGVGMGFQYLFYCQFLVVYEMDQFIGGIGVEFFGFGFVVEY